MNARHQAFFPFALGAIMVLSLTGLLARYRYETQLERETRRVSHLLEGLSKALSAELNGGASALNAVILSAADPGKFRAPAVPSKWQLWQYTDGDPHYSASDGSPPLIGLASLRRDLPQSDGQARPPLLLGPYSSDMNLETLTLAVASRTKDGRTQWWGATIPSNQLFPDAALTEFLRQGLRLQLLNGASGVALYQSDPGDLKSPVQDAIPFVASDLQLRAAPRDGWAVPLRQTVPSLFLGFVVAVWLTIELRRGGALREAADKLEEAESRRQRANLLYGDAIESVAVLESRLQTVHLYDTGTGLANQRSLMHYLGSGLETIRNTRSGSLGVLAIGLDQLQHIGNSFGADLAARVLVVAAERVHFVLPSKDMLYRVADAQLAVLLTNPVPGGALALADRIISEIEAPISIDSHTFILHPSVGIAETSSGYQFVDSLLDQAKTALGAALLGTNTRRCVFDSATARESVGRLQLEADLVRAFEDEQFTLEFEPIMTPGINAVVGFEALIRWNHPTEGRVPPATFVPIVVQSGMSARLDRWVMRQAAQQAKAWRSAGHNVFISFNLSAEVFLTPTIEAYFGELLAEFDLSGKCLTIELTEATLIQDLRGAIRTLQRLNELGIHSWLDDFGTGYSSLSHLRELPLKGVKIDRSFVNRTVTDARDFGFLKSLIDLISYLGMQSIAEGVVSREQIELLGMTTCDYYQGTYFASSMSPAAAELWLNEKPGKARAELSP